MNKKISTLLTAGLLMVGALLGSANAAPTAEAAKGDLQNGAKFYLGIHGRRCKRQQIDAITILQRC